MNQNKKEREERAHTELGSVNSKRKKKLLKIELSYAMQYERKKMSNKMMENKKLLTLSFRATTLVFLVKKKIKIVYIKIYLHVNKCGLDLFFYSTFLLFSAAFTFYFLLFFYIVDLMRNLLHKLFSLNVIFINIVIFFFYSLFRSMLIYIYPIKE